MVTRRTLRLAGHCSGSNEAQLTNVGLYGVLDQDDPAQVVIGDSEEPEQFRLDLVDYCVEGDLLHWRQELDGTLPKAGVEAPPLPEGAQPQCTKKPGA